MLRKQRVMYTAWLRWIAERSKTRKNSLTALLIKGTFLTRVTFGVNVDVLRMISWTLSWRCWSLHRRGWRWCRLYSGLKWLMASDWQCGTGRRAGIHVLCSQDPVHCSYLSLLFMCVYCVSHGGLGHLGKQTIWAGRHKSNYTSCSVDQLVMILL